MRKSSLLFEKVAARIQLDLPTFSGLYLPPMVQLCRAYDASTYTLVRAAALLRKKGIIAYVQGRRMRICARAHETGGESAGASDALVNYIEERVKDGRFRAGARLPKVQFFASTCTVSRNTVYQALATLERKNLVHRHTKKWFAGPATNPPSDINLLLRSRSERPSVVLVMAEYQLYRFHTAHHAYQPLFAALLAELHATGIDIIISFRTHSVASIAFPSGMPEVRALIKRLGSRYMGCFLSGSSKTFPDIEHWLTSLSAFRKPVALFRSDVDDASRLPSRLPAPGFRVYIDAGRAAKSAVELLHRLGHRRIALMQDEYCRDESWMKGREQAIRRSAQSLDKVMAVETVTMPLLRDDRQSPGRASADQHGDFTFAYIERLASSLREGGLDETRAREEIRRQLGQQMESLDTLVKSGGYTAIIAASDEVAAECYLWLLYTGRRVPEDFSMISFDNNPKYSLFRFSTFDWRRDALGYLAAHSLIGDIAVKKDANGNITTPPRLVDRGSLGRPPKQKRN